MTTFSQSIIFSKDNFDSINTTKKINYNHSVFIGDKIWSTSYKNKINNKTIYETFNKLHKDGDNIYEKIGNSQNKNSWMVKEFSNTVLEKEYDTPYDNNNFTNIIIDALNNIDESSIQNIDENKLIK